MNQVTMRGVNLNHPKSRCDRTPSGLDERANRMLDFLQSHRPRLRVFRRKLNGTGGYYILPPSIPCRDRALTSSPWPIGTGLSTRVGELNSGGHALGVNKTHN